MSFEKQVANWSKKAGDNLDKIYRASIRDVIAASTIEQPSVKQTGGSFQVGKVPTDTRELAESLFLEINGSRKPNVLGSYRRDLDRVKAENPIRYGWDAEHARKMEFGDGKVEGRFFATKGANKWRGIVNKNAARFSK